ncbi:Uncharacterised protein [Mycobacteroides abscessus subsp. abscessus]|nr:Uncharacterised protein [Mycobacteroides abscessus subsp. abscessus]
MVSTQNANGPASTATAVVAAPTSRHRPLTQIAAASTADAAITHRNHGTNSGSRASTTTAHIPVPNTSAAQSHRAQRVSRWRHTMAVPRPIWAAMAGASATV